MRIGFRGKELAAVEILDSFGQRSVLQFSQYAANVALRRAELPLRAAARRRRHRAVARRRNRRMDAQEPLFDTEPAPRPQPPTHAGMRRWPSGCGRARWTRWPARRTCSAPGKPLRVAFEVGRLHSMILWGPPGVGKTTLARLMAGVWRPSSSCCRRCWPASRTSARRSSAPRPRAAPAARTMVFVDEVHRFNKAQQDAFLPHVESGLFTFIGATTENPSFEVNSALLSRATVHVLQAAAERATWPRCCSARRRCCRPRRWPTRRASA